MVGSCHAGCEICSDFFLSRLSTSRVWALASDSRVFVDASSASALRFGNLQRYKS